MKILISIFHNEVGSHSVNSLTFSFRLLHNLPSCVFIIASTADRNSIIQQRIKEKNGFHFGRGSYNLRAEIGFCFPCSRIVVILQHKSQPLFHLDRKPGRVFIFLHRILKVTSVFWKMYIIKSVENFFVKYRVNEVNKRGVHYYIW